MAEENRFKQPPSLASNEHLEGSLIITNEYF
jgi:hypothetical protein